MLRYLLRAKFQIVMVLCSRIFKSQLQVTTGEFEQQISCICGTLNPASLLRLTA